MPVDNDLSNQQLQTLAFICETLCPPLPSTTDHTEDDREHSANIPQTVQHLTRRLAAASRREFQSFSRVLNMMERPGICLPINGSARPFSQLTRDQRESALRFWCNHKLPRLRQFFQSIKRLTLFLAYADEQSPGLTDFWQSIEYSPANPIEIPGPAPKLAAWEIGKRSAASCDFLVIGSGAGGSVAAEQLARAGHDVIVVEKGILYSDAELGMPELDGNKRLFEKTGALATRDLSMVILAGSTVGGGTTVNWMTSLDPPQSILDQWSSEHGLARNAGTEYQDSLRAVKFRLNVNPDESQHNCQNDVLKRGCEELGYRWRVIPRNVDGCTHCDFCGYGCRRGAKQDTRQTFLKDAIQLGARLLPQTHVEKLVIRDGSVTHAVCQTSTHGDSRQIDIRCKAVVVACGAIQSPALLMRSGIGNRNLGRHLHLHPTSAVVGFHHTPIDGWKGAPQSVLCDEFHDLSGDGFGVRLEVAPLHPGFAAMALAWASAKQHKSLMRQIRHVANTVVICRDRQGGQVTLDQSGQPIVRYHLGSFDAKNLMRGLQAALEIQRSAGAHHIIGPHQTLLEWRKGNGHFEDFVRRIHKNGTGSNRLSLYSAHQMSSCRISNSPKRGVFDPEGRCYGVRNIFVADGSALPTSCGVNPMITIMTTAHYLSQFWK